MTRETLRLPLCLTVKSDTRVLSPRTGKPSIISAMQQAGKTLVSAAKRAGLKASLPLLTAVGILLGGTQSAQSSTVTITVTGYVTSATDTTGVFGFAPGTDISGQKFTLTFTFDDTQGQELFTSTSSLITSTNSSNPGTAVLQIGAGSYEFDLLQAPSSEATVNVGVQEYYLQAGDGYYGNGDDIQVQIYAPNGTTAFPSPNWETAFTYSSPCSYSPNAGYNISFWIGNGMRSAGGYMLSCGISVSGPTGVSPLAKTLGNVGGNTCGCSGSDPAMQATGMAQVAEPIEVGSGNLFYSITDYKTVGQNPLEFIRYYNSMGNTSGVSTFASSLGTNWRSNYDRYLQLGKTSVVAERPDGQEITFTRLNGLWQSDSDVDASLVQSGSIWTLTDGNDTVETYTTATGLLGTLEVTYGLLESIKARNGYTQTLDRVSASEVKVIDSYGRALTFSFASGLLQTVETPDTLVLTYGMIKSAGRNQLTSVSYNTSPVTNQTYIYSDAAFPFALTGVMDENGKRYATWTYDGQGRANSSQLGSGANLTKLAYNSDGTTTVTNALGVVDTYKFSILQGVSKVTEIDRAATSTTLSATRTFAYDSNGYLKSSTDWNGNQTTYANDSHGQPTTITEASGSPLARTTTITYDTTWIHLPHQIVTPGLTSTFTYDAHGNSLTRSDADTTTNTVPYSTNGQIRVTTWTWSGTGQLKSVRLPRTDVKATTNFTYTGGTLTQIQDALGHLQKIVKSTPGGLPLEVTDPNNVETDLNYDFRLNLHTSAVHTSAGLLTTTYMRDAANILTGVQLPDGSQLTYGYDNAHRLTSVTDLFGNSINYTLDALGDRKLSQVKLPDGKTVTQKHSGVFDALGRLKSDIGGAGQTTRYTYDNNGNVRTIAPPSPSGVISNTWDTLNRLHTIQDPAPGGITTINYDAHDRITSVEDANNNTTAYVYDGFGDRTQTSSPDSGTTVSYYDGDGDLTQSVKPGPLTANFTYDALDRNKTVKYPADATLSVSRTYDQTGHGSGVGRLTSVTDQVGSLSLTYDERGNVKNETRVVTGTGMLTTATSYDNANRVSGIAYPSGTVVAYGRDTMGRVTSVTAQLPGSSAPSNVVTGIAYEPFGPETALNFGNGIAGSYGYDLEYRPTTRVEIGSAAVQNLTYGYYTNDSVMTITDAVNAANTQTLGYDALDRLTSAKSGAGGYGAFAYKWDPVGNITSQVVNGTTTTYTPVTGSNQLSQWMTGTTTEKVASTPAGNINTLTVGTTALNTLNYNQANQLSSAASTTSSATYKYDFAGQRLEKALPGSNPILYEYGITDGTLLSENDLHKGQTADNIYLNGRPIAEVDPTTGKLYFTHTDRLGTPQKLTDSTQAVAWSALYEPFGGTTFGGSLTTQSLRLPGQQFDTETGLYHNGLRDYAPGLTRYVESDPIGLAGGMNIYQYVRGNPFKYTDQTGLLVLPNDPAGLPPDWYRDYTHRPKNGSRWRNPDGGCLDFNPGRPGMGKNQEKDHWHDCTDPDDDKRKDKHWFPGQYCPQPGDEPAPMPDEPSHFWQLPAVPKMTPIPPYLYSLP